MDLHKQTRPTPEASNGGRVTRGVSSLKTQRSLLPCPVHSTAVGALDSNLPVEWWSLAPQETFRAPTDPRTTPQPQARGLRSTSYHNLGFPASKNTEDTYVVLYCVVPVLCIPCDDILMNVNYDYVADSRGDHSGQS